MAHICSLDILFFPVFHNFSDSLVICTSTHSYAYICSLCIFCILVLIPHACVAYISCSKALFPFQYAGLNGYGDAWSCSPMTSVYRHIFFAIFELFHIFLLLLHYCYVLLHILQLYGEIFIFSVMLIFIESLSSIILFVLKLILPNGFLFFYFFGTYVLSYNRIFLYILRIFFI